MPKAVIFTIVLLAIHLFGSVLGLLTWKKADITTLDILMYLGHVILFIALLVGMLKKRRWAWIGIRCCMFLIGTLILLAIFFELKLGGMWAAPNPIFFLVAALYLITAVELGSRSSLAWFQFSCPKCGDLDAIAYFSLKLRCVSCGKTW
jgi:hypothetical protein